MPARNRHLDAALFVPFALLAATAAGCTSAEPGGEADPALRPPGTSASSDTRPTLVLGPDGVGPLRLGMRSEAVDRSGVATSAAGSRHDGWQAGCRVVTYDPDTLGRVPAGTTNGVISAQHGLEQLSATSEMVTPEGIRIGSSLADVGRAYARTGLSAGDAVVVAAFDTSVYRIQLDPDAVVALSLELRKQACTF